MHPAHSVGAIVAIEARALAVSEEDVRLAIVVVVDGAYAAATMFDHAELETRAVLFDIELGVALVFVVNANRRQFFPGLKVLKVTAITAYANSFDEFILYDLPVVSVRA